MARPIRQLQPRRFPTGSLLFLAGLAVATSGGCGGSGASSGTGGVGSGAAGQLGSGGATSTGTGGATGIGSGGATTGGGTDAAVPTRGGSGQVYACTPGVEELVVTNCGYPATGTPLSSTVFNENEVLRAIRPAGSWPNGVVQLFFNDEHAMTLGVRQVVVKSSAGTTTTDYPVTPLATDPGSTTNPQTGTNMLVGDQSGLDQSLRPMWPSLFVTDISADSSNRRGDWQQGGRPIGPNAIFGTWKSAVRTVDKTQTPAAVSITPDADPAKNSWTLAGSDPVPSGLSNQGYGAEARWNVPLVPGHSYRLQVIVHDGDQNKAGGDSGEACVLFCAGAGSCGSECGSTGTDAGTPQCPSGTTACGSGGVDPASCPSGTVCANGCCLPDISIS
jgi:hypothetical protein